MGKWHMQLSYVVTVPERDTEIYKQICEQLWEDDPGRRADFEDDIAQGLITPEQFQDIEEQAVAEMLVYASHGGDYTDLVELLDDESERTA